MSRPSTRAPLTEVLAAIAGGARSLAVVSERTGLGRDIVDAAVDHLVRTGHLEARTLGPGCPESGCGSCASGAVDGSPGCGATGPSPARSGAVLVTLSLRREGLGRSPPARSRSS